MTGEEPPSKRDDVLPESSGSLPSEHGATQPSDREDAEVSEHGAVPIAEGAEAPPSGRDRPAAPKQGDASPPARIDAAPAPSVPSAPPHFFRPLGVALAVCLLLALSFLKQLSLMSDPSGIHTDIYLWLPCLGLAAGLVLAFGSGAPLDPHPWPLAVRRARRSLGVLALAAVALICSCVSALLQFGQGSPTTITVLWVLGMVAVLAAAAGATQWPAPRGYVARLRAWLGGSQGNGWWVAILGVILVIAIALRATALDTIPGFVHFDEAGTGIQARQILSGQVASIFSNGYGNLPTLGYAWDALFIRLFGDNLVALRLSSTVPGIVSILLVALLGKELFTIRAGLLAAALLTLFHYHIHYSRTSLPNMHAVVTCLLTLYLVVRALRYDSRLAAASAGVLVGVDLQVYFAGRVVLLLIPVMIGYVLFVSDRSLRQRRWAVLAWMLVATIVGVLPVLVWILDNWQQFTQRTREVLVLGGTPITQDVVYNQIFMTHDPVYILRTNLWRAIQTFNYAGDTSDHYDSAYPLLDPVSAALLPTAVVYACCRAARGGFAICLLIFFSVLIFAGMLTIDQPDWDRLILLGPVFALIIAAMLEAIWQLLDRVPRLAVANAVAVLALLATVAYGNYNYYFNLFQPRERAAVLATTLDVGNFLHSLDHPFYAYSVTTAFYMDWAVLAYLAPNSPGCSVPTDADLARCPTVSTPDRIFFLDSSRTGILPTLRRQFPGGTFSVFHTYSPSYVMYTYRVRT